MLATGSGTPVMVASLVVGAVIVIVAFIVRRVVLATEAPLPRRPARWLAIAFGRPSAPDPVEPADPAVGAREPDPADAAREHGSAA
jgi:hypothetical protein